MIVRVERPPHHPLNRNIVQYNHMADKPFNPLEYGVDVRDFQELVAMLNEPDGGYRLAVELPVRFTPDSVVIPEKSPQTVWASLANMLMKSGRFFDAIAVYDALYMHMLKYQQTSKKRTHMGMPLVWISECFFNMNYPIHAKRYLMYTLCEDAVAYGPTKRASGSGVYFRAVWHHGMSDQLVTEYTRAAHQAHLDLGEPGWFPERLLAELDDRWMTESPSEMEYGRYWANSIYVRQLLGELGESNDGQSLERLRITWCR